MFASEAALALRRPSIAEVDATVRAKLGMTRSPSKAQPAAFNRQVAVYLAHRLGGWSTIRIGKFYNCAYRKSHL